MENKKKFEEPKAEFVEIDDSIVTQAPESSCDVVQYGKKNKTKRS